MGFSYVLEETNMVIVDGKIAIHFELDKNAFKHNLINI